MRSSALAVALGFAQLSACSHAHAHVKKALGHRHGHLHERGFVATVIETVLEYTTEIVYQYDDGATAPPPTSSSTVATTLSTTSRTLAPAVFIEKSSSSTPVTTATPPPKVESPPASVPPPAPVTTAAPPPPPVAPHAIGPVVQSNGERVIQIINMHTSPVSTWHDDTTGTPTSAGKPLSPGTIAPGAVATFAVTVGWVGNIAIGDAEFPLDKNSATLLELNYNVWKDFGPQPRVDMDVSFVDGFTLPATCSCEGRTVGCNKNLHDAAPCPGGAINGVCLNPLRAAVAATEATSFFSACQGSAWTFVEDGHADVNCPNYDSIVSCCIGTACPRGDAQRG